MNYNFYVKNNRAVNPRNIVIDNKYSNDVSFLNFNFDDVEDLEDYTYKYIALKINSSSYILPIVNDKITITSNISKLPGLYTAVLILRNRPYEETTEEFKQFVSNEFYFEIKSNFLTETIGTEPTEENIAAWYEQIETYVHSDEFKEDCKGDPGPAGEDGASGTTFIPSVNTEGVISWTNDGELPNPESRNIKGPKGDDGNDIYNSYVNYSYWCGPSNQPEAIETRPFYFKDSSVYNLVNNVAEGAFYQVAFGDKTKWLYYKWTDGGDTTACLFKYWLEDEIDSSNFWSKQLLRVELWKNGEYKLNYHTDYTNMNDDTYIVSNSGRVFLKHYILSPEDFADEYLREQTSSNSLRKGGEEGKEVGTK